MTKCFNIRCLFALCLTSLLSLPAFSADPVSTAPTAAGEILVVGASGRSGVYIVKALEEQARAFRPMTSNIQLYGAIKSSARQLILVTATLCYRISG